MKLHTLRGGPALVLPTLGQPCELRTRRTLLRPWRDSDLAPWARLNADPEVRRHFASRLTLEQSMAEADRMRTLVQQRGWGLWALEIPGTLPFAGIVGLHVPTFEAPFMPAVEMGWRLDREAWGQGWASEAAAAAAAFAFDVLGLDQLVAFTVPANLASRRVMQRLGMTHDPAEDFDHPRLDPRHALCRHVLYRLVPASLQQPV